MLSVQKPSKRSVYWSSVLDFVTESLCPGNFRINTVIFQVDCSKYNEHKELIRGPRPDYDQYGADSPPELSEDQKKICEDQWNLEQYREWVNNNANRIQVILQTP